MWLGPRFGLGACEDRVGTGSRGSGPGTPRVVIVDNPSSHSSRAEHVTRLEEEIMELTDNVQQVQDEQKYMWARERRARDSTLFGAPGSGTGLSPPASTTAFRRKPTSAFLSSLVSLPVSLLLSLCPCLSAYVSPWLCLAPQSQRTSRPTPACSGSRWRRPSSSSASGFGRFSASCPSSAPPSRDRAPQYETAPSTEAPGQRRAGGQ